MTDRDYHLWGTFATSACVGSTETRIVRSFDYVASSRYERSAGDRLLYGSVEQYVVDSAGFPVAAVLWVDGARVADSAGDVGERVSLDPVRIGPGQSWAWTATADVPAGRVCRVQFLVGMRLLFRGAA